MSDLDKNIHRKNESSPYGEIITNPIEKDRRERGTGYPALKNTSRAQVFATLVSCFKKILTSFTSKGRYQGSFYDQQHLLEHVLSFRELLMLLGKDDLSHHPDFTKQWAELWHNLLDDCNTVPLSQGATSEIERKLKFFLSQIKNFPVGADHSLGYYLEEYAGKDWIPFPFMELLQALHEEHLTNPVNSTLQNWILLLDDILAFAGVKSDDLKK